MNPPKKNTNEILYKLELSNDDKDDIILIAIKSNMPDYKIAYHLNRHLNIKFCKVIPEISVEDKGTSYFRSFKYEDEKNYLVWRLFENKSCYTENINHGTLALFEKNEEALGTTNYLIPEWRTIDYFLLIENTDFLFDTESLLERIQNIPNISTQFEVAIDSLNIKSQKNLIF